MKRKTFKIGEYAIGGKIHIAYDTKQIIVRALGFKSNEIVSERISCEPLGRRFERVRFQAFAFNVWVGIGNKYAVLICFE